MKTSPRTPHFVVIGSKHGEIEVLQLLFPNVVTVECRSPSLLRSNFTAIQPAGLTLEIEIDIAALKEYCKGNHLFQSL